MAFTTEDRNDVIALAVAVWDAAPGASNLSELAVQFNNGATMLEILEGLTQSEIFTNEYPAFQTNEEFAAEFVGNVVGGKVSAEDEQWAVDQITAQLNAGASQAEVILGAIEALEAVPEDDANWGDAAAAFNNKVEVATYFSVTLEKDGASLADLRAVLDGVDETEASVVAGKEAADETTSVPPQTFTMTVGVDDIVGGEGNDTINALTVNASTGADATTVNSFDSVDGGAGTDTLNLYHFDDGTDDYNSTLPSSATVKNVEIVNILNDVSGAGVAFETSATSGVVASRFQGAEQIWQIDDAVSVSALAAGQVAGFRDINAVAESVTAATGAASISVAVDGLTGAGTLTTIGSNAVNVSGSLGTGGSLTLDTRAASTSTTSLAVNTGVAATVDTTNAANAGLKTLDASGSTGAVTYTLNANAVNVTTGSGGDDITINTTSKSTVATGAGDDEVSVNAAMGTGSTVNLGAGDDSLTAGGGSLGSAVVDGGDGIDTISATLVTAGTAANIQNFEVLDLANYSAAIDADLLTESSIQSLALTGNMGGTATIQNLPGTTALDISGFADLAGFTGALGNLTITQKGAASGTSDSFDMNFNAAPSAAATTNDNLSDFGTLTHTGTETVNIASGGGSKQDGNGVQAIVDTSNSMETINVSGATDFTLGSVETDSQNAATTGTVASTLTMINGSTATGDLNITAGANTAGTGGGVAITYSGLTINGGSGNDTITNNAASGVVNAGDGDNTVTASGASASVTTGEGDDTITISGNGSSASAGAGDDTITASGNNVTVTTGAGEDTVIVSAQYGTTATSSSSGTGVITTTTDLAADDVIDFGAAVTAFAKADISAAQTLDQAIFAAGSSAGANEAEWFNYGGNTYIVNNTAADTDTANDIVVKLNGVVDLSTATLDSGDLVIG